MGVCGRNSALVGFIDDVDCAVASLTLSPTTAAGASLTHIYSIPAFAYVATGASAPLALPLAQLHISLLNFLAL